MTPPQCLCEISRYWAWVSYGIDCSEHRVIYWYHPDYLGNTEYITDWSGNPYQYFWYSPWGESLEDQHRYQSLANPPYDYYDSPYAFNGKEFDFETGNYYYVARYYDPKVSVWLSVDPLASKSPNQTPYHFVSNNPIMRIDPNGLTDYYNLAGEMVHHVEDDKDIKMLVLTKSCESEKISKAIENNEVISMPTTHVLGEMDEMYSKTENTGNEHAMWVGTEGTTSEIVEGTATEVSAEKMTEARNDLISKRNKPKGEVLAYDVHTDPTTGDYYGSPEASDIDKGKGYFPQSKVVLGYRENMLCMRPGKTVYGRAPVDPVRHIGFYNSSGTIETMSYKEFKSVVALINKN